MPKRFRDTGKWNKKWWRGLSSRYKLFFDYLCDVCDHAGVWEVDKEAAELYVGEQLDLQEALEKYGHRVRVIDGGNRWWLTGFVRFQYGDHTGQMSMKNKMYEPVCKTLEKYGVSIGDACPIDGSKVKVKDKEKVSTDNTLNNHIEISIVPPSIPHQTPIDAPSNGDIKLPWDGDEFAAKWKVWKDYKWQQHQWRYGYHQEVHALEQLWRTANGDVKLAIELIGNCITKGYKNIGNYTNDQNGKSSKRAAITTGKFITSGEGFFKKR